MEKLISATDVIVQSILSDPTRMSDMLEILKFADSSEARAAAIRSYCGRSLSNCLSMEREVIDCLIDRTSWVDVACRLDTLLAQVNETAAN